MPVLASTHETHPVASARTRELFSWGKNTETNKERATRPQARLAVWEDKTTHGDGSEARELDGMRREEPPRDPCSSQPHFPVPNRTGELYTLERLQHKAGRVTLATVARTQKSPLGAYGNSGMINRMTIGMG